MPEIPIYLDPCLLIPQGTTPQERAKDKERILAELEVYAQRLRDAGAWAVVGIPPWMGPSPAWLEVADA